MTMSVPEIHRMHFPETDSTNNAARRLLLQKGNFATKDKMFLVTTDFQTTGRGQRGNTWESEREKNLLFSLTLHPNEMLVSQQFVICEFISVALCEVLSRYTDGICIKWPNDIYFRDQKLGGILIENDIDGDLLACTIIGVGLNVNQTRFADEIPNPTSLCLILKREINREELLAVICERIVTEIPYLSKSLREVLHCRYISLLYRRDIPAMYRNIHNTFMAILRDVKLDGHLVLEEDNGHHHDYLFKEVSFII